MEFKRPTRGWSSFLVKKCERVRPSQLAQRKKIDNWKGRPEVLLVYELKPSALSFDFCLSLAFADAFGRDHGASGIRALFLHDSDLSYHDDRYNDLATRDLMTWKLNNILVPLTHIYEGCHGFVFVDSKTELNAILKDAKFLTFPPETSLSYRPTINHRDGWKSLRRGNYSGVRAPDYALKLVDDWMESNEFDKPLVVLTLRERLFDAERNSDTGELRKFAIWLTEFGYQPVFIPDTDSCWSSSTMTLPFPIFREASFNLYLRTALYERAFLCIFKSNGPAAVALCNPSIAFIMFNEVLEQSVNNTMKHFDDIGLLPLQSRYGFFTESQKFAWKPDTFMNCKEEFLDFLAESKKYTT